MNSDTEKLRTEFLRLAEEILERANTDNGYGTRYADEIRKLTDRQAAVLDEGSTIGADELRSWVDDAGELTDDSTGDAVR